eukprot:3259631-Prorocentrum_lima.AAC.1
MTSSLVGSEMCIRDRFEEALRCTKSHQARPDSNQYEPGPRSQARLQTVSYTHLTLPTICSV